ncbi:GTP pyrophosphokinase family protein [Nocardioides lijunqiniae]|uniref:GTP pyrophosphokinase n=1 Tax=Nocardioides lijunqiniae TaxID=2760832 RepID=UPI0030B852CF
MSSSDDDGPGSEAARDFLSVSEELEGFLMLYRFGLEEMMTKVNILKQELTHTASYDCPIEHVTFRLKRTTALAEKARRLGCTSLEDVRELVSDIAGIRVVCSFVSDAYTVLEMLQRQPDVRVVQIKDYIADPKPSGYKSLHLIVEIPVFLSDRTEHVRVEIQIRTVAMDFWASLEHKIHYKYQRAVPERLRDELAGVAAATDRLDQQMEQLHRDSRGTRDPATR